jgi:hypothetical protein
MVYKVCVALWVSTPITTTSMAAPLFRKLRYPQKSGSSRGGGTRWIDFASEGRPDVGSIQVSQPERHFF